MCHGKYSVVRDIIIEVHGSRIIRFCGWRHILWVTGSWIIRICGWSHILEGHDSWNIWLFIASSINKLKKNEVYILWDYVRARRQCIVHVNHTYFLAVNKAVQSCTIGYVTHVFLRYDRNNIVIVLHGLEHIFNVSFFFVTVKIPVGMTGYCRTMLLICTPLFGEVIMKRMTIDYSHQANLDIIINEYFFKQVSFLIVCFIWSREINSIIILTTLAISIMDFGDRNSNDIRSILMETVFNSIY